METTRPARIEVAAASAAFTRCLLRAGAVLEALEKLHKLAEKKKVDMAFEHFRRDVRTAVEDFL